MIFWGKHNFWVLNIKAITSFATANGTRSREDGKYTRFSETSRDILLLDNGLKTRKLIKNK